MVVSLKILASLACIFILYLPGVVLRGYPGNDGHNIEDDDDEIASDKPIAEPLVSIHLCFQHSDCKLKENICYHEPGLKTDYGLCIPEKYYPKTPNGTKTSTIFPTTLPQIITSPLVSPRPSIASGEKPLDMVVTEAGTPPITKTATSAGQKGDTLPRTSATRVLPPSVVSKKAPMDVVVTDTGTPPNTENPAGQDGDTLPQRTTSRVLPPIGVSKEAPMDVVVTKTGTPTNTEKPAKQDGDTLPQTTTARVLPPSGVSKEAPMDVVVTDTGTPSRTENPAGQDGDIDGDEKKAGPVHVGVIEPRTEKASGDDGNTAVGDQRSLKLEDFKGNGPGGGAGGDGSQNQESSWDLADFKKKGLYGDEEADDLETQDDSADGDVIKGNGFGDKNGHIGFRSDNDTDELEPGEPGDPGEMGRWRRDTDVDDGDDEDDVVDEAGNGRYYMGNSWFANNVPDPSEPVDPWVDDRKKRSPDDGNDDDFIGKDSGDDNVMEWLNHLTPPSKPADPWDDDREKRSTNDDDDDDDDENVIAKLGDSNPDDPYETQGWTNDSDLSVERVNNVIPAEDPTDPADPGEPSEPMIYNRRKRSDETIDSLADMQLLGDSWSDGDLDLHGDWDSEDSRRKRDAENVEGDDDATIDSLADMQLQGDSWSDDDLDLHGDWDSEDSRRKRDAESIEGDDDVTVDSLADNQPLGDSGSDDFDLYEDWDPEDRRRKRDAEHAAVKRAVKKSKNVDPEEKFERWKKKTSGRWEAAKKKIRDKYHEWNVKNHIDFENQLIALREKRRQQYDKVVKRFEDLLIAKKFANENKKETKALLSAAEVPYSDFANVPTRRRLLSVSVTPTKVRTVLPGTIDPNVAIFKQMVNHERQLRKEALKEIRNKYNLARKKNNRKQKDYRVQLQQKFRRRLNLLRKRFQAKLMTLRKSNKKIVRKRESESPPGPSRRRLLSLALEVQQPVKSEQDAGLTSDLHEDWDSEDGRLKRDAENEEGDDDATVDSLADIQLQGDSWSDDDLDLHGDWDSEDSRRKRDAESIEGDDDVTVDSFGDIQPLGESGSDDFDLYEDWDPEDRRRKRDAEHAAVKRAVKKSKNVDPVERFEKWKKKTSGRWEAAKKKIRDKYHEWNVKNHINFENKIIALREKRRQQYDKVVKRFEDLLIAKKFANENKKETKALLSAAEVPYSDFANVPTRRRLLSVSVTPTKVRTVLPGTIDPNVAIFKQMVNHERQLRKEALKEIRNKYNLARKKTNRKQKDYRVQLQQKFRHRLNLLRKRSHAKLKTLRKSNKKIVRKRESESPPGPSRRRLLSLALEVQQPVKSEQDAGLTSDLHGDWDSEDGRWKRDAENEEGDNDATVDSLADMQRLGDSWSDDDLDLHGDWDSEDSRRKRDAESIEGDDDVTVDSLADIQPRGDSGSDDFDLYEDWDPEDRRRKRDAEHAAVKRAVKKSKNVDPIERFERWKKKTSWRWEAAKKKIRDKYHEWNAKNHIDFENKLIALQEKRRQQYDKVVKRFEDLLIAKKFANENKKETKALLSAAEVPYSDFANVPTRRRLLSVSVTPTKVRTVLPGTIDPNVAIFKQMVNHERQLRKEALKEIRNKYNLARKKTNRKQKDYRVQLQQKFRRRLNLLRKRSHAKLMTLRKSNKKIVRKRESESPPGPSRRRLLSLALEVQQPVKSEQDAGLTSDLHEDLGSEDGRWKRDAENEEGDDDATVDSLADIQLQGDSWSDDDLDLHGDWDSEDSRRKRDAESIEGDDDVTVDSFGDIQPLGESGSDDFDLYEDWDPEDRRRKRDAEHAAVKRAVKKSKNVDPVERFEKWKKKTSGRWEAAKKKIRDKYHEWNVKNHINFENKIIALREKRRQQYDKVVKRFEDLLIAKKFANENKKETKALLSAAEVPYSDFANVPTRRRLLSVSVTPTKVRTVLPGTIDPNVAIFKQMVNHERQLRKEALKEIRNKYNLARKKTNRKQKDYRVQLQQKFRHRLNLLRKRSHAKLMTLRKSNKKIVRKRESESPPGPSRRRLLSLALEVQQPVKSEQDAGLTSDLHGDWDSEDGRWKRDAENEEGDDDATVDSLADMQRLGDSWSDDDLDLHGDWDSEGSRRKRDAESIEGDDDATVDSLADIQLQGDSWSDDDLDLHGDWDSEGSRRKREAESIEGDDDVTVDSLADIQPLGDSGSDDFALYEDWDPEDRRRKRDAEHAAVKRAVKKSKNVDPVERFERWKKKTSWRWEAAKKKIRDKYHEWNVKNHINFENKLIALREKRRQQYDKVVKRIEDLLIAKKFANENKKETKALLSAAEVPYSDFANVPTRRRLLSVSVTPTKVRTVLPGTIDPNIAIFKQMVNHERQLRKEALKEIRNKYNLARKKTNRKQKDYRVQLQQKFRHRLNLLRKRSHAKLKTLRKSNKKIVRKRESESPPGPSRRRLLSLALEVQQPVKSEQDSGLTSDLHGDWDSEDGRWKRDAENEEGDDDATVDSLADMQLRGDSWSDDDLDLHGDWDSEGSRRKREAESIEGDDDVTVDSLADIQPLGDSGSDDFDLYEDWDPEDRRRKRDAEHAAVKRAVKKSKNVDPVEMFERWKKKTSGRWEAAKKEIRDKYHEWIVKKYIDFGNQLIALREKRRQQYDKVLKRFEDLLKAKKFANENKKETQVLNLAAEAPSVMTDTDVLDDQEAVDFANVPTRRRLLSVSVTPTKVRTVSPGTIDLNVAIFQQMVNHTRQLRKEALEEIRNKYNLARKKTDQKWKDYRVQLRLKFRHRINLLRKRFHAELKSLRKSNKKIVRKPANTPVADWPAGPSRRRLLSLPGVVQPVKSEQDAGLTSDLHGDWDSEDGRWKRDAANEEGGDDATVDSLADMQHLGDSWSDDDLDLHGDWDSEDSRRKRDAESIEGDDDVTVDSLAGIQPLGDSGSDDFDLYEGWDPEDRRRKRDAEHAAVKRAVKKSKNVGPVEMFERWKKKTSGRWEAAKKEIRDKYHEWIVKKYIDFGNELMALREKRRQQYDKVLKRFEDLLKAKKFANENKKETQVLNLAPEAPSVMTDTDVLDDQTAVDFQNVPTRRRLLSVSVTPTKVRTVSPGTLDLNVAIFQQMVNHTRQLRKEALEEIRNKYNLARKKTDQKWKDYRVQLQQKFRHRIHLLRKRFHAELKSLRKSNKKIVRKPANTPVADWPAGPSRRRLLSLTGVVQPVKSEQNAGLTSDLHGDWDSEDRRWKRDAANEEGGDNAPVDSLADMQRLGDSWSDDDLDLHGDWDSEDSRRKRDAERIEGDDDDTDNDDDDENDDDDVQVKSSIDDKKLTPYEANAILRILRTNSVSGPEDKTFISNGFHNVQGISPVQVQGLSPNAEKIVSKASNAYGGLPENAAAYTEVAHAGNANQAHPENSAANQVLSNSAYGKIHVALPESPVVDDTVASKMSNSNTVIPESPVINTVVPKTANAKRVLPEIPVANPGVSKVVNPQIVLPKTQVAAAVDTKTANPYLSLLESQIGQGSQMANTVISKTANANRVLPVSPVAHTVVIKPDAKNIILPEGQVADTVITNAANSDKVLVRSPGHPVVDTVFSKTGNANAGRLATHTLTGSEVNAESLPANTAVKKAVKKGKNVDLAEKFKRWRKKTSRYWKNINKKLQDKYHGWKMKKHREWKNKAIATQEKRRQEYAILVKQFEDSLKAKKFAKENKTGTQVLDPVQPTYSVSDSAAVADLQGAFQQQYAQVKPINMGIPVSGRVNSDTLRVAGKSLEKVVLPETLGSNLVNGMAPSVGLQGQTRFVKPSLPNSYVSQVDEQGNPIILKSEVEEPQVLQPVSYSDPSAELQNRGQNYLLKPGNSEVAAVEAPFVMTGGNGLDGQGPVHVVNFPTRRRLLSISVTPMKVRTVSPGTIDPNVAIFKQMTDHTRQLRKEAIKGVRHRYKLAREKAAKKWNDYKAYLRKKFSHRVDLLKKRYRAKLKSLQSGGKSNKKIVRKLELESPPAATWPVAGPSRRRLLSLPEEVQHVEPGQNLDPMIKGDGSADVVVVVRKTGQATNDYSNTAWDIPEADRSLQKPDCAVLLNSMTDRFTKWQADVNSKWQQTIQWKGKYMQLKQQAKKITDKAKIWKTKRLKKMRRKEKIETARCKKASNIRLRKKRLIQSRSAGNLPRPNLKTQLRNGGEGAAVRNGVRYRTRRGADSGDSSLRNPLSYVAVNQDSYLVKATNTMHQKTNDRENNVIKFDDKNQLPNPTRGINLVQNAGRSDIKQPQSRNHPNMVNKVSEQLHGVGKIYGGYLSGNDTRMHAQITTAVPKDKSSGDTWFHYFRKMPVLGDILEFFVSFFGSEDKMQDANPVHNSTNKEKNLVVETGDLKTQHRFRRNEMHVGSFDEHSEKQGGRHLLAISRQGARMNRNGKNCANRLDKLTNRLKKREMGVLNKERKNRVWKNRYRSLKEKVGVLVIKIREWKEKEMALILRREENIRLQCRKAFHQASTRLSSRRNRIGKRKRKQKRKPLADPKTSVKVQLGKQRKGAAVGNGPRSRGRRRVASREKESGYRNGSGHEAGLKSKLHIDDPSLRKAATFDGKRHQVYSISMKTDGQLHDNSYNREKNRVKPVEKSRLADHTQANPDASKVATKLTGKPKVYSMSSKKDKSENIIIAHASTTVAVSKDTSSDDTWFEYFRKLPILGDILDFFVSFFGSEERILDKIEDNHPLHLSREKEDRLNAVISDKGSSKTWQPLRQNNKQTDGLAEKMPNEHAENQVDKKPGNRRLLAASEKDDSDGQMKNRAEADIDRNLQQHIDDSVLRKADAERRRRFSGNTWSKLHNNPYDRKNNRVEHAGEENHNVVAVIDDVVRTNVIISNFDDRRYSSKKQGKDVKTNAPMTTDISKEGLVENPDTLGQFFLEIFSNVFRLFSSIFVSSEKNLAEASEKKSSQIQSGEKSLNLVSTGEGAPKTGQRLRRDETKEHNMRQLRSTKTKTKIQQDEDSADDGEKNENPNFDYEDSSKKPGPTVPPTPPFIPFVETHEKLKEYGSDGVEFDVGDPIDVFKRAHFLCNPNDVACIENGTQTMSIHTVELWKPLPRLNETVLEMIENETRATDEDVKKLGKEIHDLIKQNEEKKEIAEEDQKRRRKKRHVTDDVISPDEVNRRKLLSSSDGGHIFKRSAVVEDEIDTYAPMNIMDEDDIEDDWGPSNNDGIEVREEIQPDTDYSEWAEWQSCSVTCGSGFRSRTRTCQGQKEHCEYGNIETELCELSAC